MNIKYVLLSSIAFLQLHAVDIIVSNKSCSNVEIFPLYSGHSLKWTFLTPGQSFKISTVGKPLLALRWRAHDKNRTVTPYVAQFYTDMRNLPGIMQGTISGKMVIYSNGEYFADFGTHKNISIQDAQKDMGNIRVGEDGQLRWN